MALPKFEIIDDSEAPQVRPQPRPTEGHDPAFNALMLMLKTMSQKTLIALSRLTSLAMVASVFWLFMSIPDPHPTQLIWGGMYSVFILLLTFLMSRRNS